MHRRSPSHVRVLALASASAWLLVAGPALSALGRDGLARAAAHGESREEPQALPVAVPLAPMPCSGGMAGPYPCQNVNLLAVVPGSAMGGGNGNDVWGWTDPQTAKEYALVGRSNGTSFLDISNPASPIYLGRLPTHTSNSTWRSLKVYNNHVFVVSEAANHGLQVFDLTQLRNVPTPPATFTETAFYGSFADAHTLALNEATGFAYVDGSNACSGGAHIVNVQTPAAPVFAGCDATDGYTHEAQCVVYQGPDSAHVGKEICFNSNEDTLTIVDVTNKSAPQMLSRTGYVGSGYVHQGWLTEDHHYFLLDDELDEQDNGHNTRTYVWNMADLDAPQIIGSYTATIPAIDHNQYIRGQRSFQANYRGGLRVLDLSQVASGQLSEAGYFDTYPSSNSASFNGAWSVYPYFPSGVVVVNTIESGLFVLDPSPAVPVELQSFAIE